jgi:ornithine cyclodeaminase
VLGAGIVILATTSERSVIEADWIEPGTHVNTIGSKTRSAHETPPELVEAADVAVTDSPAQVAAYSEPFFTNRELVHLGAILAGAEEGRRAEEEITVYCSTGLAGSEVAMALAVVGRGTSDDRGSI